MKALGRHAWDAALAALALAFGAVSLCWPFGRDQGLYYYVAREWVLRGAIPYRDVLDHKTPGIYILHAISIFLFGETQWGIRILDLCCVVFLGLIAAGLTVPRGIAPKAGIRGAGILSASVLYYGFFDFWNTGQSELWYSTFAIASIWAALRLEKRAAPASGAFAAAALVLKPPAMWLVLLAVGALFLRARRERTALRTTGLFALGAVCVIVPVFGYFAAHRALGDLVDIVVGANGYYVSHERGVRTLADVVDRTIWFFRFYNPLSTILLVSLVAFGVAKRKDAEVKSRHLLALGMCAAAYAAVVVQAKFYLLHWGVVIPPAAVVATLVASDVVDLAKPIARYAPLAYATALLLFYFLSGNTASIWLDVTRATMAYKRGQITREEFTTHFAQPVIGYWYHDSELVGLWLRDHSSPEDLVAVRGFEPEIYVVAGRRYPGRFFWTTFLVNPDRAYKREQWLDEERRAFAANPPRYVVTLTDIHEGLDSTEYHLPLGYVERERMKEFTILERAR
jgi:hypothetical protein